METPSRERKMKEEWFQFWSKGNQIMRKIKIGDVVQLRHSVFDSEGMVAQGLFTGTVIFKNRFFVTVQGDHYSESFLLHDLTQRLHSHFPA